MACSQRLRLVMQPGGTLLVYSSRPTHGWSEAARELARCCPIVVTDERGRGLRDFLRTTNITVWIEASRRRSLRRVLVAVDPFAPSYVTTRIIEVARLVGSVAHAELFAVHAWDAPGEQLLAYHASIAYAREYVAVEHERACQGFADQLRTAGLELDASHQLCARGEPCAVIAHAAAARAVDAIVLGMSDRPRLARALLGCTAVRVAKKTSCHVVVAPSPARDRRAQVPRAVVVKGAG